jgi:NADH-quinone oxidoreductase subunit H
MGGLRSSAQMISYELPMALALAAPLLILNTLSLREIANGQAGYYWGFIPRWAIFQMPFPQIFSFILFLIAGFAETNRVPFDLPEAENELVAGFHVEYASMKFASFFMAEYANMVTVACIASVMFLGGWSGPVPDVLPMPLQALMPVFWFLLRVVAFLFLYIWIRGTLPRFRYDQLMAFGWKFLLPLAIANIIITSLIVAWRG